MHKKVMVNIISTLHDKIPKYSKFILVHIIPNDFFLKRMLKILLNSNSPCNISLKEGQLSHFIVFICVFLKCINAYFSIKF